MSEMSGNRWAAHPRTGALLRALVFIGPVLASLFVGWLASGFIPLEPGWTGRVAHTIAVLALSTVALVVADRLIRRLLPLATLLQMSLLFPGEAPSRLKVARTSLRRLTPAEHVARIAAAGDDPAAVAREIVGLVSALDNHDKPTRGHAERVRLFTDLIADQLKLDRDTRDRLLWASLLHDVGKLTVPAEVLNKPGKPDDAEWEVLKGHPARGREIAEPLLEWLGEAGRVIVEHHERWDGTGYPAGLSGEEIGLCSRLVSVADAYDVMTATRAYRRPVSRAAALEELVKWSGRQFDPIAVRAMVGVSIPRLRRAQGILGWLGDVPFLATQTVPLSVLARVAGAGAMTLAAPGLVTPPTLPAASATPDSAAAAATSGTPHPGASTSAAPGQVGSGSSGSGSTPGSGTAPGATPSPVPTTGLPTTLPSLPTPVVSVPPVSTSGAPLPTVTVPPISVSPVPLPTVSVAPITIPPVTVAPLPTISVPPVTVPPLPLPTVSVPPITTPPLPPLPLP